MRLDLEEAYRNERERLLGYARARVGSIEAAEDIVQEVFLRAVVNANSLAVVDNAIGWLYVAIRNRIIDLYRARSRRPLSLQDKTDQEIELEDLIADSRLDVEGEFLRSVVSDAMVDAIDDLSQEQRYVIIGQMVLGRTFRDLAEESGVSINTLLARKRYAVRFLRRRLEELKTVIDEYTQRRKT